MHPLPGTFFPFFSASQFLSLYLSHFLHLSLLLSQCGALVQRRAIHPFVLMREVGEDSHWLLDWASLTELSLRLDTGCACACSPAKRRVDPFRESLLLLAQFNSSLSITRLNAARAFSRQGNRLSLLIRAHQTSRKQTKLTVNTKPTRVAMASQT